MKSSRVGIYIQARSNSSRLPGKVYEPVSADNKRSILEQIYSRLAIVQGVAALAVLIPEDDHRLASFCGERGMTFLTGPSEDVRERYRRAALYYETDIVVRATGDNPCVDADVARDTIREISNLDCDLFSYHNLPLGVAVEAMRRSALLDDIMEGTKEHREHVSLHIKHHANYFKVIHKDHPLMKKFECQSLPRLTVDTPEDLLVVRALYNRLGDSFSVQKVLELYLEDPSLFAGNSHIKQLHFPPLSRIRK